METKPHTAAQQVSYAKMFAISPQQDWSVDIQFEGNL